MNDIKKVINLLSSGGLAILPTDTAVGICCRIDSEASVEYIYDLRGRSKDKPLLVLASSIEMAEKYVVFDEKTMEFAKSNWPGGITVILPCKENMVPSVVRAGGKNLGVRVPANGPLRRIIEEVGVPLVAPSANKAGERTPYSIDEVDKHLISDIKIVLEGECTYKKESTIVDTTVNPWKIIRAGAVEVKI